MSPFFFRGYDHGLHRSYRSPSVFLARIRGCVSMRILIAIFVIFFAAPAFAGLDECNSLSDMCTAAQARALAQADCSEINSTNGEGQDNQGWTCYEVKHTDFGNGSGWFGNHTTITDQGGCDGQWTCGVKAPYPARYYNVQCPSDAPWNPIKMLCGGCSNAPDLGSSSIVPFVNNQRCADGCVYQPKTEGQRRFDVGTSNESVFASGWSATGQACEVETPSKQYDPDKPICKAYSTGASFCLKPNGDSCYTDSGGKQLCWGSSDTGKRNTTDNKLGGDRQPPDKTPGPPDNMTDPQQQHSENTTINNYNTTTNIYNGSGAASPGQGNTGVRDDGNGDGQSDSGEDDGEDDEGTEPGSVSGGTDCSSPPQVVGGDAVAAAQLFQQWKTRCATEAQNGQPDWTKVTGDGTGGEGEEPDGPVKTLSGPISRLDQTGFGLSRSCPDFGTVNMGHFGTFDVDPDGKLCDFLLVVRGIFGIMGLLIAIKILGGN